MVYYMVKIAITTLLIVAIAEIAKRSTLIAAVLASVPLVSVLAMIWLYIDTRDVGKVTGLAISVFWLVLPSLVLFVTLPVLLKIGINFYLSMGLSILATAASYLLMLAVLSHFGVKL